MMRKIAIGVVAAVARCFGISTCRCAYEHGRPRVVTHRDGERVIHGFRRNPPEGFDQPESLR